MFSINTYLIHYFFHLPAYLNDGMQKHFEEIIMKEKLDIEKMNYLFLDIGVKITF